MFSSPQNPIPSMEIPVSDVKRNKADIMDSMEKELLLLVINPGSTSTKVTLFSGRREVRTESIFHDAPELLKFRSVNDQVDMRKRVILDFLGKLDVAPSTIDIFVGRGGSAYSQHSGVFGIDERLYEDAKSAKGGSEHPAKLGILIAYEFAIEYGRKAYTVDPTNVDEFDDVARLTGIKGLYRTPQSHVLNQKGIARLHSGKTGRVYEESNYIVAHIDGGITINAHRKGRMIDGNIGAGGDGPFTPTRIGSVPVSDIVEYLKSNDLASLDLMCSRSGGFVSYFGTSNADKVHEMVEKGDRMATLLWRAVSYQIGKEIGAMAAVLEGKVDAILLTGGLLRFDDLVEEVERMTGFIAPVYVYPGEVEQEAMAYSVLDVIEGKRELSLYTGHPVFSGF